MSAGTIRIRFNTDEALKAGLQEIFNNNYSFRALPWGEFEVPISVAAILRGRGIPFLHSQIQATEAPVTKGLELFHPENFVMYVPLSGNRLVPINIQIIEGGVSFSAAPDKGEMGELEAIEIVSLLTKEFEKHNLVIERMYRDTSIGRAVDRVRVYLG